MNQAEMCSRTKLPMYFGDFGGILIPDSFIPDVVKFAEYAEDMSSSKEFQKLYAEITGRLPEPKITYLSANGQEVLVTKSQTLEYMVAGYLALVKLLGTAENYIGADQERIALFAAEEAKRLGIKISITLNRELSKQEELIQILTKKRAAVDCDTCLKLYDRPQAYAFQKYLGDREHTMFIPVGQNLGPYPFPALSHRFAVPWGARLKEMISQDIDACAVTMLHGNAAVAVFPAFEGIRRITVEQPICQEYHGEFCGCALLMVRPSEAYPYSITICPEVADMWRLAKAARLGAEDYTPAEESEKPSGISGSAARALNIINRRIPGIHTLLIVEGEDE